MRAGSFIGSRVRAEVLIALLSLGGLLLIPGGLPGTCSAFANPDDGDWPDPDGTASSRCSREHDGAFTDDSDGSYTYVYAANLSAVTTQVEGTATSYERNRTDRVSVMMGGHDVPTTDANFEFVPDPSAVTQTRDIVETATCLYCHGVEFADHGGELQGFAGPDGVLWDNPAAAEDESADIGEHAIGGNRDRNRTWWKVESPAVIENCTACREGSGAHVDNWKHAPARAACGSCHDTVNFVTGTNQTGRPQRNDALCLACIRTRTAVERGRPSPAGRLVAAGTTPSGHGAHEPPDMGPNAEGPLEG